MHKLTKRYVRECTGATPNLVDTWAHLDLSVYDFCTFIAARIGRRGPAPCLPEPERITELFRLWHKHDGDVDAIAGDSDEGIILIELKEIGLIK